MHVFNFFLLIKICVGKFLKDKIKILKSFFSNLKKIRAFLVSPEHGCLRHLTGFTRLKTWAQSAVSLKLRPLYTPDTDLSAGYPAGYSVWPDSGYPTIFFTNRHIILTKMTSASASTSASANLAGSQI